MLYRWVCLTLGCLAPVVCHAGAAYLDELVQHARVKQLAQRQEWRDLLHYKPNLFGHGLRSLADDPAFFLAPGGKTDPEAELEATLAAFFSDVEETDKQQNPQCAFIARYHWLNAELAFDPKRLPPRPCKRFDEWYAAINPYEITLVFPAAFVNSPASMYGHTLLRIDAKGQDEHSRLLAYSVSYAAATSETNGLTFAIKGVFGGYPGVFATLPYYMKVKEYNDLENRDIWEYRLNFTPAEIERLLMHLWELQPIYFDYYFFDENCSYHLLALMDVARPGLRLTDRFPLWAIPADTVRVVVEESGLLKEVVYRPARATWLRHAQRSMDSGQQDLAKALANSGPTELSARLVPLVPEQRARVLDLAYEYLEYQRMAGARGKIESPAVTAARLRALLLARNQLDVPPAPPVPVPRVRPDEGHGSARVGVGIGTDDKTGFQEIRLRPVYHDLLDPEEGYGRGSQIEFFNLALRHTDGDGIHVERLNLVDITSLAPRNRLLKPLSWNIDARFERRRFPDGGRPLVFALSGGPGLAYELAPDVLAYGYLEGDAGASRRFEPDYALGLGPSLGVLAQIAPSWRFDAYARAIRYGVGDAHDARALGVVQAFSFGRRFDLRFEVGREREFDRAWNTAAAYWLVYF